jgi:hypothetical protein
VIVQMPMPQSLTVEFNVLGKDERTSTVPMIFIHEPSSRLPHTMISQHGSSLALQVRTRGSELGMNQPGFLVPDLPDSVRIVRARVCNDSWSLEISNRARNTEAGLQVAGIGPTPLLAWMLILPVPLLTLNIISLINICFAIVLLVPVAWWISRIAIADRLHKRQST